MPKITKRAVDALCAPQRGETYLWDSELKGFAVRVGPSGAKTYMVQYRNEEGRTRKLALGRHGPLTAEQARRLAMQQLGAIARGEDPSEVRRSLRTGLTVGEVCDWYLENARSGRILGRRRKPISPKTLDMDESRIERHIRPLLGARSLLKLTLWDVESVQAAIVAGETKKARAGRGGVTTGGPGVASRSVGMLRSILGHAVRAGLIERNPAAGARLVASTPRTRCLSTEEIRKLGEALRQARAEHEHPVALAAIRLALLTGFRRMEVLGLQRSWAYGAEGYVRFPHTKTGPQIRPLGPPAAALVADQPRLAGSHWVFPADVGDGHFVGLPKVFERVCARAGIEDATLHTLRHTFASVAAGLNFSELTIAGLLGHAARGVTQGYVHLDRALVIAAGVVSAEIDRLLGPSGQPRTTRPASEEAALAEHLIASLTAANPM
jgi:integrase